MLAECLTLIQASLFYRCAEEFYSHFYRISGENSVNKNINLLCQFDTCESRKICGSKMRTKENNGKVDELHKMMHCSVCGKRCKSSRHLRVHMVAHCDDCPFPCDVCKKRFKHAYELKVHKRIHYGEVKFSCEICGYVTFRKFKLILHQKWHFNQCNFQCCVCSKGYCSKYEVEKHMQFMQALNPSSVRCVVMGNLIRTT
jgi:hypothetical protein